MISVADTTVPQPRGDTLRFLHFTVLASLSYVRGTAHI